MIEIINNPDFIQAIIYLVFVVLPLCLGYAVLAWLIYESYWYWVWKGMDEDNSVIYFKAKHILNQRLLKKK